MVNNIRIYLLSPFLGFMDNNGIIMDYMSYYMGIIMDYGDYMYELRIHGHNNGLYSIFLVEMVRTQGDRRTSNHMMVQTYGGDMEGS